MSLMELVVTVYWYKMKLVVIIVFMMKICLPGQHFSKKIAGCSSSFVPFSSLDSHKTAVLTLGVIKNFFKGNITNNPYLSWKGDNQTFVNAGFKTSNRFELSENELFGPV